MSGMSQLERILDAGGFVLTAEIVPPLSAARDALLMRAAPLRGRVTAVNVTDAPGARPGMSGFAAGVILAQAGFEPVVQVACRDRNRIALAGDLLGAAAQGVKNIMVLHGDSAAKGDMAEAKEVHDLDSRGVMALARTMCGEGRLPGGREIVPPPHFFIGGADTPFDPPADWRADSLGAKVEAGARFAETQFCFDIDMARRYFARLGDIGLLSRIHMIAGIGPVASARSARWINDHLFGVTVPEDMIARLEGANDPREEGIRICAEQMQRLREIDGIAGLHVMAPLQTAHAVADAIDLAGLAAGAA